MRVHGTGIDAPAPAHGLYDIFSPSDMAPIPFALVHMLMFIL